MRERLRDRLQAESDYLKAEIRVTHAHDEVTGQGAVIKRILRQVEQVAPTSSTVLICGETGTGKERIAQAMPGSAVKASRSDRGRVRMPSSIRPIKAILSQPRRD